MMERDGEMAGVGGVDPIEGSEVVDRLGLLNEEFFAELGRAGWTPDLLSTLVLSRQEAAQLLRHTRPSLHGRELVWGVDAFWGCIRSGSASRRRSIELMARACKQPRLSSSSTGTSSQMADNYDAYVSENTHLARQIYKSQRKRALRLEGGDPALVEDAETKRWAMAMGTIISDANLPAKKIAEATLEPTATWIRLCGNRRARTLRQGVRSWERFAVWLNLAKGTCWPRGPADIIDYLEERAQEPCGPTIPGYIGCSPGHC